MDGAILTITETIFILDIMATGTDTITLIITTPIITTSPITEDEEIRIITEQKHADELMMPLPEVRIADPKVLDA